MDTFIITGERNEGKTSFLRELFQLLRNTGRKISGFISPGKFIKTGCKDFVLLPLTEKQSIHLASRENKAGYKQCGPFFFNPEAVKQGNHIIENGLAGKSDIIIMDEIGPIELTGEIWHDSLKNILKDHPGILIITVRKEMLEKVIDYFELKDPFLIDIKRISPENAADIILEGKAY